MTLHRMPNETARYELRQGGRRLFVRITLDIGTWMREWPKPWKFYRENRP